MAKGEASRRDVVVSVIFYSICSSMMLVVNKLAMMSYRVPAVVNLLQLTACTIFIYAIGAVGVKTDPLKMEYAKPYAIYVCAFAGSIYANMKALAASNVETIIVFRACAPFCTLAIEYFFMDRMLPSKKSAAALSAVAFGAYIYVSLDAEFAMSGISAYFWVLVWYFLLCFQMTYGKKLLSEVKLETVWGPVLYTNLLSIPPTIALGYFLGDFEKYETTEPDENATLWVSLSCVLGIAIGYSGWWCRDLISATSYTLVGVINKLLTVTVSVLFINTKSSPMAIGALVICLLAGSQYEQPPKRSEVVKAKAPSEV
eukprot:m.289300 g.289300  ORF g.289300 m.289300 type:complete len:314 (+) comp27105_c0_seq1:37-978(+)